MSILILSGCWSPLQPNILLIEYENFGFFDFSKTNLLVAKLGSFMMCKTFSEPEGQRCEPDELHQVRDAQDARGVSAQPARQPLQDAEGRRRGRLCRLHLALPRLRAAPPTRHEGILQLHLQGELRIEKLVDIWSLFIQLRIGITRFVGHRKSPNPIGQPIKLVKLCH